MSQVVAKLKAISFAKTNIITEYHQADNYKLDSQSNTSSNDNSELSQNSQIIVIKEIKTYNHINQSRY